MRPTPINSAIGSTETPENSHGTVNQNRVQAVTAMRLVVSLAPVVRYQAKKTTVATAAVPHHSASVMACIQLHSVSASPTSSLQGKAQYANRYANVGDRRSEIKDSASDLF